VHIHLHGYFTCSCGFYWPRWSVIDVPPVVRNKAVAAGAADWLDRLGEIVAGLEADWGISVGAPYDGGTEAFVAEAVLADGTPAVLKVGIPRADDQLAREVAVLRLCAGEGCVALLRANLEHGALLLERLGPSMYELGLPVRQRQELLWRAASRVWRPAPGCGLPTGAGGARWLASFITATFEALDRPCTEAAVDYALACARRRERAHDDERAVLVHGDVHQWNALSVPSGDGEFKLVDPDGLLAEAEYDLGIIMREDPVELLEGDPWERARWLARATGREVAAIWEWGVIQRVSTGLLATQVDLQPVGREMLRAADTVASVTWRR
jgi:streptomycin 6-kinase